jgi:hypothetical protein
MYFNHRTYVSHDVDIFFTRTEMLEIMASSFETVQEAKKSFNNLFSTLKILFNSLEEVTVETPNLPSSGNILFKLKTNNENSFNLLLTIGENIQQSSFLDFFIESEKSIQSNVFDNKDVKHLLVKNLKSYFLYQSLSDNFYSQKL